MTRLFRLVWQDDAPACRIDVDIQVGGRVLACPVSEPCTSAAQMQNAVDRIRQELDDVLAEGRARLEEGSTAGEDAAWTSGSPDEIWSTLSAEPFEERFIERFNSLGEDQRREVAEYVFANCSVFSGRPAVLSSRYDNATALMD